MKRKRSADDDDDTALTTDTGKRQRINDEAPTWSRDMIAEYQHVIDSLSSDSLLASIACDCQPAPLQATSLRCQLLHSPKAVIARDMEWTALCDFLLQPSADTNDLPSTTCTTPTPTTTRCLYISGQPGTGKTASLLELSRLLEQYNNRQQADPSSHRPFTMLYVNCMEQRKPEHVFQVSISSFVAQ
jgi:Cdc6-like AAA superfamily ATPase